MSILSSACRCWSAPAPDLTALGLVPLPTQVELKAGNWTLERTARLVARGVAAKEAKKLAEALSLPLGWRMPVVRGTARKGDIELTLTAPDAQLGAEGYRLSVTPDRVTIRAATAAGLFYGGITFRQLLPPAVLGTNRVTEASADGWSVRAMDITDSPRFGWRGLLVDPARHFLPFEFLKRLVDLMALHKLNTLQIHLTDDQGWRLEIKKHPRLTTVGSRRAESPRHGDASLGDSTPYGPFFYTQAQMRELVAYAQARHITILPEIEMPGHFQAALAAYPQFSCTGGPFEVRTRWGVHSDILCPGNDAAVAFARDVLAEVVAVFPSRFIHIGGDEAPRDRWKTCPKCQARIQAEGLKGEPQLQTRFNGQIERFLVSKGRRMIGWDEILEGGLTPGAAVMSWRGMDGGIAAAEAGHDVVMSPTTHCYFDYAQAKGAGEPESIGGFIPLEKVYGFEPVPGQLPAEKQRHVLGAQGNLWGEFLWTPEDVEYSAFPRAAALAEVVWSPVRGRDYPEFLRRLERHLQRLDPLNVRYRKLAPSTRNLNTPRADSDSRTRLGLQGIQFTLNSVPVFLLGFSYYGALGASEESIRLDLDDARRAGFNWLRVWATWAAFDHDVSAVGADGRAREPFLGKLRWLVAECDRRGLVVDVTLTRGKVTPGSASAGRLPNMEAHLRAVETLVGALKDRHNWYLDLANERDVLDDRFVSIEELKRLREHARRLDPTRLVTASFGGHDLTDPDVHAAVAVVGLDFLSPHRPRTAESPGQTEAQTRACLELMKRTGRVVPVHHQEPFRRGYDNWEPTADDFLTDLRGAVAGGAAGWCFHNGTQRNAPDEQPRRSFDLGTRRLFEQLDAEEQRFIRAAAAQVKPQPPRR